jgi:hypothetical protein
VQTVSITPEDMASMEKAMRDGTGSVDIENFGKFELTGEQKHEKTTMEAAQDAVDFRLNLPAGLPGGYNGPEIYLDSGGTMNFTLDTVNINQLLKSFGSEKLLPDELNGKTFTVVMPPQITAAYNGAGNREVVIGQCRSPELLAPGSDVMAIRDSLLALPFLPDNLRSQLASINDWQHTLIVPSIEGSSQEVSVSGSQGVFIKSPDSSEADHISSLIWQKDGVVSAISGSLTLEQAQEIAGMMK